ncbi:MAG: UDP-forming cellulose synthase catalytic subunit, partial [Burkholderiaceae bacterium]|nr:UDP-forming cellulose synthase catalytic subunit [Burkholderiaceae bacterium]
MRELAGWRGWEGSVVRWAVLGLALPLIWLIISTPLTETQQLLFGAVSFGGAMFLRKLPGRFVTQMLIVLSLVASTRYMYWRVTETMNFETWANAFFGSGLFLAELYAWIV